MDIKSVSDKLNAVIPGVAEAYLRLRAENGMGIYTSNGAFYNHTLFGRDAGMTAKFVAAFDHKVAQETIVALVALQGTAINTKTQEQPGRIHHELRDFKTWDGRLGDRLVFRFLRPFWGVKDDQLLSYYAVDTTGTFIRLVNKYVHKVDRAILDRRVTNAHGETVTVAEAVAAAAEWITEQLDENHHFVSLRSNKWSIQFQTFQDSSTAYNRSDGSLMNFKRGITYIEAQAFAIGALEDATRILEDHPRRHYWQEKAHAMRDAFIADFWDSEAKRFGSAIDVDGLTDMDNISIGWTLNTSFWEEIPKDVRAERISAIVRRLFADDMLTRVGIRTRSIAQQQPMPGVVEYHGSLTVWPMFNFMVIEGLRRHGLLMLAEQLENRLINGLNAVKDFDEFFVVDREGTLLRRAEEGQYSEQTISAQMAPEQQIAFSVVPAETLAYRALYEKKPKKLTNKSWQQKLERDILKDMQIVERAAPEDAYIRIGEIKPVKFKRFRANLHSSWYVWRQSRKM
jgi:glycogen debranching enzyme